jgi:cell division protein FtsI/penicillin-binding protein 2
VTLSDEEPIATGGREFTMNRRLQSHRLALVATFLGLAFAGLVARLAYLQVVRQEDLGAIAVDNTSREMLFEPRRGDILDAKGNLLATSIFVKTVCADPTLLGHQQTLVARALAPVLEMPEAELYQRLLPRLRQTTNGLVVTNHYVVLKQKVSTETWLKVQQTMTNLTFGYDEKKLRRAERLFLDALRQHAIFTERVDEQLRVYPHERLAAHVLGSVGTQEKEFAGQRIRELIGTDGVESTLNSKLNGVRGWRKTEIDVRRREQVDLRSQEVAPRDGLNAVLTIDSVVQHKVEETLAEAMQKHSPLSASCLVVRPKTGEILALASLPDFDPNKPGGDVQNRRNRLVADAHEPGSTFKIVVVAGALNEGRVTLQDEFFCEHGVWIYAGRPLHDHEPYDNLPVERIITKSSNIGAAKIALKLGPDLLYRYMQNFGIGARTGIPLLSEQRGIAAPVKDWTKLSITRIAMGHEVSVTPLQITLVMCAIANHGVLMRPMLVDHLEDRDGAVVVKMTPQPIRRVLNDKAAHEMVQALKTVVTPDGTAEKAMLENYTAAGKTGTAQKAVKDAAGKVVYLRGKDAKYFSSFIGFFPADNPELCVAVFLDAPREGYYGGRVAGPIFKQIAEYAANYLNIPPDAPAPPSALPGTNRVGRTPALTAQANAAHN